MKKRLSTEEIIKRLRTPAHAVNPSKASQKTEQQESQPGEPAEMALGGRIKKKDLPLVVIGGVCLLLILITLSFYLMAKNRAEDLVAALDPGQLQGLRVEANEFNPNTEVTYIQVQEGQDRNVAVDNLGSTLPIISRFNLKTFTDRNYQTVGAAPWALTTNFSANISDPALIRILLDNDLMDKAFLARADVAPLLEDPQMLLAFVQDEAGLAEFFNSEVVQQVLNNDQLLRMTAGSRFISYLLISPAGKYFRSHPQEAVPVIEGSPTLKALRNNPSVRKAVAENPKLSSIASLILGPEPVAAPVAPKKQPSPTTKNKKQSRKKK